VVATVGLGVNIALWLGNIEIGGIMLRAVEALFPDVRCNRLVCCQYTLLGHYNNQIQLRTSSKQL
jgi:hypothetical protein